MVTADEVAQDITKWKVESRCKLMKDAEAAVTSSFVEESAPTGLVGRLLVREEKWEASQSLAKGLLFHYLYDLRDLQAWKLDVRRTVDITITLGTVRELSIQKSLGSVWSEGKPDLGTLRISSDPDGADIIVDGKGAGTTNRSRKATVGKHTVEIHGRPPVDCRYEVVVVKNRTTDCNCPETGTPTPRSSASPTKMPT